MSGRCSWSSVPVISWMCMICWFQRKDATGPLGRIQASRATRCNTPTSTVRLATRRSGRRQMSRPQNRSTSKTTPWPRRNDDWCVVSVFVTSACNAWFFTCVCVPKPSPVRQPPHLLSYILLNLKKEPPEAYFLYLRSSLIRGFSADGALLGPQTRRVKSCPYRAWLPWMASNFLGRGAVLFLSSKTLTPQRKPSAAKRRCLSVRLFSPDPEVWKPTQLCGVPYLTKFSTAQIKRNELPFP